MVRRAFFPIALIAAALIACAGPQADTTTTTGGTVMMEPASCAHVNATCESEADCCSLQCIRGVCEPRLP